jgi:hypothetical protein
MYSSTAVKICFSSSSGSVNSSTTSFVCELKAPSLEDTLTIRPFYFRFGSSEFVILMVPMNDKYCTYNIGVEQSLGPFGFRHFISKVKPHSSIVNNGIESPLFFLNLMDKMLNAFLTSEIKGFQDKISLTKIVKKLGAFFLRLFW